MRIKEVLLLILNIGAATGYEFKCPTQGEWMLRAKVTCLSEDTYVCLLHLLENKYQDDCLKSDKSSIGSNLVFQPLLNLAICNNSRFQPIVFTTLGNSECILLKSKCNEEGQIVFSTGSSSNDTSCRCDYTKGYAFVSRPKNSCFCIPSEEDCSCFKVQCKQLSPDYRCITDGEMTVKTKYQEIRPQISNNKHDQTFQSIESNINRYTNAQVKDIMIALIVVIIVVPVVMVVTRATYYVVCGNGRHFIGKKEVDKNQQTYETDLTWQNNENIKPSQNSDDSIHEKCNIGNTQLRGSQNVGVFILESEVRVSETFPATLHMLSYSPRGFERSNMDNDKLSLDGVTDNLLDQPLLVMNFKQPASDPLLFKTRIEQNCVSIEHVNIRCYNVSGTIKVKNISFEKKVFVRLTYNAWSNSKDIECHYIHSEPSVTNNVDTFEFEFNVPNNLHINSFIEFAVCFETNTNEYWDNRNDKNYRIDICAMPCFLAYPSKKKSTEDTYQIMDEICCMEQSCNGDTILLK